MRNLVLNALLTGNIVALTGGNTTQTQDPNPLPPFVQSTINLMNDALIWLIALSGVVAVLLLAWNFFKWYSAADNEKPAEMKKIKQVFIGAIAVVVIEAVFKLILGYYAVG